MQSCEQPFAAIQCAMKLIPLLQTILLSAATLAVLLLALAEIALAYPVPVWLYALVGAGFACGLVRRASGRQRWVRIAVLLVILAGIAALYLIPWTSRKPFLRALGKVKVGMSEAEARKIMQGYTPGTGWPDLAGSAPVPGATAGKSSFGELAIPNALVFRHSNDPEFNSDWGVISLSNGVVIKVEFLPD